MADAEWYEVAPDSAPGAVQRFLNEAAADAAAQAMAAEGDSPVCMVRMQRIEIRRFQRQVTVTSTDMAVSALSAEQGA